MISNRMVISESSISIRKANVVKISGEGPGHWKNCEDPVTGPYRSRHLEGVMTMGTERRR